MWHFRGSKLKAWSIVAFLIPIDTFGDCLLRNSRLIVDVVLSHWGRELNLILMQNAHGLEMTLGRDLFMKISTLFDPPDTS